MTFSFDLTSNEVEGTNTVDITSVTARFEWVTETLFSGIKTVTEFPATLNYEAAVAIPDDLAAGPHDVIVSVTGSENEGIEPTNTAGRPAGAIGPSTCMNLVRPRRRARSYPLTRAAATNIYARRARKEHN